jgi:nucleoside-diphosphate-sugar epimerase
VVARPFTVAGERQRGDMALARWIAAARSGLPLIVYGAATRTRDVTDVRDVVTALRALAATSYDGAVNVGTGTACSLQDMLDAVQAAVGLPLRVETHPVDDDDPHATLADPALLAQITGLRPCTDLPSLVRRQADAALRDTSPEARLQQSGVPHAQ